jgi:hypothetical protein
MNRAVLSELTELRPVKMDVLPGRVGIPFSRRIFTHKLSGLILLSFIR